MWYFIKRVGEILGFSLIEKPLNVRSICILIRVVIVLQCFILRSTTGKFLVYHISHTQKIFQCLFQCFQILCFAKIPTTKKLKIKKYPKNTLLLLFLSVGIVVI